MAILAGILEYGWYLFQLSNVVHALRDGTNRGHPFVPTEDAEGPGARAEAHISAVLMASVFHAPMGADASSPRPSERRAT